MCLKYHVLTSNGAVVMLLSPGLDYQGLDDERSSSRRSPRRCCSSRVPPILTRIKVALALQHSVPSMAFWSDVKPGHGVQMFDDKLLQRLIDWSAAYAPNATKTSSAR